MNVQYMLSVLGKRISLLIFVFFLSAAIFSVPGRENNLQNSFEKADSIPDTYQTAIIHAEYASEGTTLKEVQLHLHHVLNCLEGKAGKDFDASFGNPCQGKGALEALKKGTANWTRTENSITLAKVAITLHDEKPAKLLAEAVYSILKEGK
jgi:hypothetical protein